MKYSLLKNKFDLVISDLAPNLSGIRAVDEENIFEVKPSYTGNSFQLFKKR